MTGAAYGGHAAGIRWPGTAGRYEPGERVGSGEDGEAETKL